MNDSLFLLGGARFKLSFNSIHCEECGHELDRVTVDPLGMYANELQGEWVALVPAANDAHLELDRLKQERDELILRNAQFAAANGQLRFDVEQLAAQVEVMRGEIVNIDGYRSDLDGFVIKHIDKALSITPSAALREIEARVLEEAAPYLSLYRVGGGEFPLEWADAILIDMAAAKRKGE